MSSGIPQVPPVFSPDPPTTTKSEPYFIFHSAWFILTVGALIGGILTSLSIQVSTGLTLSSGNSSVTVLTGLLIVLIAGAGIASAHSMRKPRVETISADTYFKIFGLSILVSVVSLLYLTSQSKDNFLAVLGVLGTALGFVFGKTATGQKEVEGAKVNAPPVQQNQRVGPQNGR